MALFNFGKKKEEKKAPTCCCGSTPKVKETTSCCYSAPKAEATTACCCGKPVDGICCIKVLGAGCKSCHELYEATKEAVKKLDLPFEVEYITDMEKIMEFVTMTALWVFLANLLAEFPKVKNLIGKYKPVLIPALFILLGVYIIVDSGLLGR